MIIVFSPLDVANFLQRIDVKVGLEREIIAQIYHKVPIGEKISEQDFANRVRLYSLRDSDLKDMNDFLQDMEQEQVFLRQEEEEFVKSYFKNVYLDLNFDNKCKFRKIKMRTLLKIFGYKRRSEQIVRNIENTMRHLNIKPYTRGDCLCEIWYVNLDDTIIFKTDEPLFTL